MESCITIVIREVKARHDGEADSKPAALGSRSAGMKTMSICVDGDFRCVDSRAQAEIRFDRWDGM